MQLHSVFDSNELEIPLVEGVRLPAEMIASNGDLVVSLDTNPLRNRLVRQKLAKIPELTSVHLLVSGIIPTSVFYEWNLEREKVSSLVLTEFSYSSRQAIHCFYPIQIYVSNKQLKQYVKQCLCSVDPYRNMLIDPLQPLHSNMDISVYLQFEKDENKYTQYKEAMELAIGDLELDISSPLKILFIGPGTGKLIDKLFNLGISSEVEITAIEKNPKCFDTLHYKNETLWNTRVNLVFGDARSHLFSAKQPDLIVSELLGSFGDNELAPEILQPFNARIMIPSTYTNYLRPIYSPVIADLTRPYLCNLTKYSIVDNFQPLWEFPSKELYKATTLTFTNTGPTTRLNGFQGYFTSLLYGHVKISILDDCARDEHCTSWYPIFFPVEELKLQAGVSIDFHVERLANASGVWYQWTFNGKVYNRDGVDYLMKSNVETSN